MSGPPVFLGQPVSISDNEATTAGPEPNVESDIGTTTINRPPTHGSGRSDTGAPESLASSQTIIVSTPLRESPKPETSTLKKDVGVHNEKAAVAGSPEGDGSLNEKQQRQEMIELEDGLVFLGTEAKSGKAIIKQKNQLQGGPYTQPKW